MKHQNFDNAARAVQGIASGHAADCSKEMGATPAEFVRQLRNIAPAGDIRVDEPLGRAHIVLAGGIVTVDFQARNAREIGALEIPVTAADIRFQNVADGLAEKFLNEWDRNFLRMGG